MFFEWKKDYSVGVKKIDEQHKELVKHLNSLYQALQEGKGKEALGTVLDGLLQYTKKHFSSEESLLKLYKYPAYEEHKQKHNKMKDHVARLKQKFDSGEISNPIEITNFLKDWLAKHIMETDKAYGPYLNKKSVY